MASPAYTQRPSRVMPIGTTSYRSRIGGLQHVEGRHARHLVLGRRARRTGRRGGCARAGIPVNVVPPATMAAVKLSGHRPGRRRRRARSTATTSRSRASPSTPARSSAASCSCRSSPSATATTSSAPPSRPARPLVLTQQRIPDGVAAIAVADTAAALLDVGRLARRHLGPARGRHHRLGRQDLDEGPRRGRPRPRASARRPARRASTTSSACPSPSPTRQTAPKAAVVEMGARGRGHIALLCDVARPTVGVVTAVVARPHRDVRVDRGGGRGQGRARRGPPRGRHRRAQRRRPPGRAMAAPDRGPGVTLLARAVERRRRRRRRPPPRRRAAEPLHPSHAVGRRRGASSPCVASTRPPTPSPRPAPPSPAGSRSTEVAAGLGDAVLSPWRMDLRRTASGARASSTTPTTPTPRRWRRRCGRWRRSGRRRIAVLGVMAELGDRRVAEHVAVAALADDLGIDVVAYETDALRAADRLDGARRVPWPPSARWATVTPCS